MKRNLHASSSTRGEDLCLLYCKQKEKLTGEQTGANSLFNTVSKFSKDYKYCTEQCERIGNAYKLGEKFNLTNPESYDETLKCEFDGTLKILSILVTLIVCTLIVIF